MSTERNKEKFYVIDIYSNVIVRRYVFICIYDEEFIGKMHINIYVLPIF